MRKVELRMNELEKYEKIKELVDHGGNKTRVSKKLGITVRQVNRLITVYKEKGKEGFVHGNRDRKPKNYKGSSLRKDIIYLYENKYKLIITKEDGNDDEWKFNISHFKELLKENENINVSYSYLYKVLREEDILSPRAHKVTKRNLIKKQVVMEKENQNKNEKEIEEIVDHRVAVELAHPRKERAKYFGERIEMDASEYFWFGPRKVHLHLAIDNCTGRIVGGYFDTQETLNGYYHVFHQILIKYGIPYAFLTDNRTVFYYDSIKRKTPEKDVLTQFGYACKILGVELKTTSVPQAKGMIERLNETVQGRLPGELRLKNIATIDEANEYLEKVFIPKFNEKFGLPLKSCKSVFETSPSEEELNTILAVLTPRKLDNGSSIKFKNQYYQVYDKNNELSCFVSGTEALVIEAFDKELYATIDEKIYYLKVKKSHKVVSPNFDIEVEETKEKQKYIPPMSHPWKAASFKRQMEKAHTKKVYA